MRYLLPMPNESDVYQALVSRRLQWDSLIWQVPILSFTAQAFLFTIALSPNSSEFARIVSASISMLIAGLSLTLMKSHRRAEISDSEWLLEMEESDPELPKLYRIHGLNIRERRQLASTGADDRDWWVPKVRGYITWVFGLGVFFLAGAAIVVLSVCAPGIFR